ncbi:MAG: hypothetical protein AAFY99_12970 [Pseudomonadota bacterium]
MKRGLLVACFCIVALGLASPTVRSQEPSPVLNYVSAAAMGRFTGGYGDDLAILIEPSAESDADYTLVILADAAGPGGSLGEIARFENAAWGGTGDIYGNRPSVAFTDAGSLQLRSGNDAIGRNRWQQTLTLVWRENTVILAGFTYFERDTLSENSEYGCDINLLTSVAEITNANSVQRTVLDAVAIPFRQWLDMGRPHLCPPN